MKTLILLLATFFLHSEAAFAEKAQYRLVCTTTASDPLKSSAEDTVTTYSAPFTGLGATILAPFNHPLLEFDKSVVIAFAALDGETGTAFASINLNLYCIDPADKTNALPRMRSVNAEGEIGKFPLTASGSNGCGESLDGIQFRLSCELKPNTSTP